MKHPLRSLAFLAITLSGCAQSWTDSTSFLDRSFADPDDGYHLNYRVIEPVRLAGVDVPTRPTIVFLHGLGDSKYAWKDIAGVLSVQRGHRCILVDLLGHGRSDMPRKRGLYTIAAQAARVGRFLQSDEGRALGERVVLIGESYGAATSLEIARDFVLQKVDSPRIEAIVVTAPPAFYFDSLDSQPAARKKVEDALALSFVLPLIPVNVFTERVLQDSYWDDHRIPIDYTRELHALYADMDRRWVLLAATLDMFDELRARPVDLDRYHGVTCPLLIFWGEFDLYPPRAILDILSQHAGGPVETDVVPDCGHAVINEQPTPYTRRLIRFLDKDHPKK